MRIALCDDDAAALAFLSAEIKGYCHENSLPVQLDCFSSGEALLTSGKTYEIAFLDIYLAGMNGMEVAKALYGRGHCRIVFTTISRDFAIEAYQVEAVHYLIKPLTADNVAVAMGRCLTSIHANSAKILEIKSSQGYVPIAIASIIYVEVFDKISIIHTEEGNVQTYTPLDSIFDQLDDRFLKVQRSFVVNMHFIESFFTDHVVLKGDMDIVLSRNNRGNLKKKYQQFLFDLARGNH